MADWESKPDVRAILEAAAGVFADKGLGGARVDEIARAAGVNKASLYYKVGDKDALYDAVMTMGLKLTAERVMELVAQASGPEQKVRRFIDAFAESIGQMRFTAPLMMREVASGGSHLPDEALAHMGSIVELLRETLQEGVEAGLFRPVNPFVTHMLIIGSLMFYSANEPIRQRIAAREMAQFGPRDFAPEVDVAAEVTDLIMASIRKT
jgi:TetR/AcrR family transcriptional regulator